MELKCLHIAVLTYFKCSKVLSWTLIGFWTCELVSFYKSSLIYCVSNIHSEKDPLFSFAHMTVNVIFLERLWKMANTASTLAFQYIQNEKAAKLDVTDNLNRVTI